MAHAHINDKPFPRGALIGAGLLIGLCLALTATVRLTGMTIGWEPEPAVLAQSEQAVNLNFVDRTQGGIAVYDADTDRQLMVLEPNTNGFMRGVMRGLVRQRMLQGLGAEEPFRLAQAADGRLWLSDPATGEQVYLGAFGQTNRQAFAQLLATAMADKGN
ncbi:MAG: photosynthetic complex assembly protein PuhC [Pseudomonadota bacterium]